MAAPVDPTPSVPTGPDPRLAAAGSGPLDRSAVVDLLRRALAAQEGAAVAGSLCDLDAGALTPGARALARSVRAACQAATEATADERDRTVAALGAAGVAVVRGAEGEVQPRQRPAFELAVAAPDARRAVEGLATAGYRTWLPRSPGALRSSLHTRTSLALVRHRDGDAEHGHTTQLTLRWGPPRARRIPWPRPTDADHALVDLPGPAWPAYLAVAAVRRGAARAGGRGRRGAAGERAVGERPVGEGPVGEPAAPFLGTPSELVAPLLALAGVGPDDLLVDLGCGDGRVLTAAVGATGCRAVGVEHDAALVAAAARRVHAAGVGDRIRLVHDDAWAADLTGATTVFLFLPPATLAAVLPGLLDRLPAAASVLAHEQLDLHPPVPPALQDVVAAGASVTTASLWGATTRTRPARAS